MIFIVLVLIVSLALDLGHGDTICHKQMQIQKLLHKSCIDDSAVLIQGIIEIAIATDNKTFTMVKRYVRPMCAYIRKNKCYKLVAQPLKALCNKYKPFVNYVNDLKQLFTWSEFLCQNNGQTYIDFVSNDGAKCYTDVYKNGDDHKLIVIGDVCKHLVHLNGYTQKLKKCRNANVEKIHSEVVLLLKKRFHCL